MRRSVVLSALVLAACAQVLGLNAGEPREDAGPHADGSNPDGATSEGDATAGDASAGEDAGGPIGVDAGRDSGADTSPPPRMEPQVTCGSGSCVPTLMKCELSCGPQRIQKCTALNDPLPGCLFAFCDDTADCLLPTICCGQPPGPPAPDVISMASCRPDCGDGGSARLCDPNKPDCPSGTCRPWFGYYACL
jgi:hypothetical protein